MGLAIHDLPLVRAFLTATDRIVLHAAMLSSAVWLPSSSVRQKVVELHAMMSATWKPSVGA